MAVEPAAGDHGEAVEVGDVVSVGGTSGDGWWDTEWRRGKARVCAVEVNLLVGL